MSKTLDITDFKEKGTELMKAIDQAVADLEGGKSILMPLPGKIRMTQTQYKDLMKQSALEPMVVDMWDESRGMPVVVPSDDRMYVTSKNIMEVEVVGGYIDVK